MHWKEIIFDAIDWLKCECGKGERAYFYFSGHGNLETKAQRSKGFLLAFNTGLGISLSYDIVTKQHSGKLYVQFKEGEGAEFVIEVPVV